MLPSTHRLRRSADFRQAVRRGTRAGRPTVVVHVLVDDDNTSPGTCSPQVGFVVSKAVGNAVTRNRVKRRLREIVRSLLTADDVIDLPARSRIVVRALPASSTATFAELDRDLTGAFAKAARRSTSAGAA